MWAKDADSGRNGMIEYSIIEGNRDQVFEIFPVHTGIVRTNIDRPRLDREIRPSYTLVIEARDFGWPIQSATCILHITVVDENDNAPTFPNPGPGPIYIAESEFPWRILHHGMKLKIVCVGVWGCRCGGVCVCVCV